MQIGEFIESTGRLEKYYGKEYTNEQRQIMFDELKDFSIERYRQLVSSVLKKCKYLPKISDFIEANKEEPYSQKQEEFEKIKCKKCNSTGYIIYAKIIRDGTKEFKNTYAALCSCGNSKQYKGWEIEDKKHLSNFYVPTIKELGLEG